MGSEAGTGMTLGLGAREPSYCCWGLHTYRDASKGARSPPPIMTSHKLSRVSLTNLRPKPGLGFRV